MSDDPLRGLDHDLENQRTFMASRAPVYALLLELMPGALDSDVRARLAAAWRERQFGPPYERPLLLLAALKYDALAEGPEHPLWSTLAASVPQPPAPAGLVEALGAGRERVWQALATRYLQTNETSRALAWLWPAHLLARSVPGCTLDLFDLGASAGLNLVADRLPPMWQLPDGSVLELDPLPRIGARTGFDLHPLDVRGDDDARWLQACVWTGQGDRAARLAGSIAAFRESPATLEAASAADMPTRLPSVSGEGARAIAFQSIFRDYLEADELAAYEAGMWQWLGRSAPTRALWSELELGKPLEREGPPAGITVHLVDDGEVRRSIALAICEPHPRVIRVDDAAVRELSALLASR